LGKLASEKIGKNGVSHPLLPSYDNIDYDVPVLDETFFKENTVHEISAPRLIYSLLLSPEVSNLATQITNSLLDRGKDEAFLIENTDDATRW
jgi:hypothetical protein